ncbi:MAG: hypothetical protein JWM47_4554 [Acidimicrobiales bacterium]|nr:hypothetical protein [Acidimicrobiales bacterium]
MTNVQKACKQVGVSPKVIASAITGLVVYLITKLGLQLDPVLEQAINVVAMIVAGVIAPPGDVVTQGPPAPENVDTAAGNVEPPATG